MSCIKKQNQPTKLETMHILPKYLGRVRYSIQVAVQGRILSSVLKSTMFFFLRAQAINTTLGPLWIHTGKAEWWARECTLTTATTWVKKKGWGPPCVRCAVVHEHLLILNALKITFIFFEYAAALYKLWWTQQTAEDRWPMQADDWHRAGAAGWAKHSEPPLLH